MQTSYAIHPNEGIKGQIVDLFPHDIESRSANGVVRIGQYVVRGADSDAAHPAAEPTPQLRGGIAVRQAYRVIGVDESENIGDNEMFGMLTKGRIYVECEDGSPGVENQPAFVRVVAGAGEELGAIRADADGTDAVHIPGLYFRSSGQVCILEINPSSYVAP